MGWEFDLVAVAHEIWHTRSLNIGLPRLAESFILTDQLIAGRCDWLIFKSGEPPFDGRPSLP
jgi:hypothetical protein